MTDSKPHIRPRELRREPLTLTIYVCLGCAEQYQRGRDGVPRCQNRMPTCGQPVAVDALTMSQEMKNHLKLAHRAWEEERHSRLVAMDERNAAERAGA